MSIIGRTYYLNGDHPVILIKFGEKGTCYVLIRGRIYKNIDRADLKAA